MSFAGREDDDDDDDIDDNDDDYDYDSDLFPVEEENRKRSICPKCERPDRVCWCAHLPDPPIVCRTRVTIVQHPKERKRRIRTAPMAVHGIANFACKVAVRTRVDSPSDPIFGSSS